MSHKTRYNPTPGRKASYVVVCEHCGEHYQTHNDDAAWDEANAHERATGHKTHVEIR